MKQSAVLGIDVGTSGVKVIAVDTYGEILGTSTEAYEIHTPKVGWAEQDPNDWWNATLTAIQNILRQFENNGILIAIEGISFSGQMHGLVPLDQNGNVIREAIIWCDVRSKQESEWLEKNIGRDFILEWTQNPPLPNFTVTKLLWMKNNEPDNYRKICHILLPKDYIRYRLTGDFAMDVADASGTLLFDVFQRKWSEAMCSAVGIPLSWLPPICECFHVVGKLSSSVAKLLSLPEGIPVIAGAGDQAAGALGLGVLDPGCVSGVFGTSGVVLAPTEVPVRASDGRLHTFCHAARNRWFLMGVTQTAAGALQWYRNQLMSVKAFEKNHHQGSVYDYLMEQAAQIPPGAEGLLFLPYLMGERTPHLDPGARGTWVGIEWRHGRNHFLRALLEGVSFSLKDCWEELLKAGINDSEWRVSGGGSQGQLWMEIFASILGKRIEIVKGAVGPAYGAAILAAQGVNILGMDTKSVNQWVKDGREVEVNPAWHDVYRRLYPIYQKTYRQLRPIFHDLAEFSGGTK